MTTRSIVMAALAAAVLACSGGGGAKVVPKATVRGTLAQSTAFPVTGQVSVALQWQGAVYSESSLNYANRDPDAPDPELETACTDVVPFEEAACDGTPRMGRRTCHDVYILATALLQPVRYEAASFPISFAVPVEGAPPGVALYDLARQGGSGVFALGSVIAFVDANGDGLLQLGNPGTAGEAGLANSGYQDYVPPAGAPRRSYFVTYLDGHIEPESIYPGWAEVILNLPQGYAIWQKDEVVDGYGRQVSVHRSAQPIETTRVELVTRPGLSDSAFWCAAWDEDMTWLDALPSGEVPDFCWANGLAAQWMRSTMIAPCTYTTDVYYAGFTCTDSPPPWQSSCP